MPVEHITLFFAYQRYGWVEQFFRSDGTMSAAVDAAVRLASARWSILGAGASLYKLRVSQVGAPRVSFTTTAPGATSIAPALHPIEGALLDVTAGQGGLYHRRYTLRGFPQEALERTALGWDWSAKWKGEILGWLAVLIADGWEMQCWGRAGKRHDLTYVGVCAAPPPPVPPLGTGETTGGSFQEGVLAFVADGPEIPLVNPETDTVPTARVGLARWEDGAGASMGRRGAEGEIWYAGPGYCLFNGRLPHEGGYGGGGYLQTRPRLYLPIRQINLVGRRACKCGPAPQGADVLPTSTQIAGIIPALAAAVLGPAGTIAGLTRAAINPFLIGVPPFPPIPTGLIPPVPPRPPPFHVPPPYGDGGAPALLTTLHDVGIYLLQNTTFANPAPIYRPFGLAPVRNLGNTWIGVFAGVYFEGEGSVSFTASIAAGLGFLNIYGQSVVSFIRNTVPAGADLLLYGFSLGGMTAELVARADLVRPQVRVVITLASPPSGVPMAGVPILRFKVANDDVPQMSPIGFFADVFGNVGYQVVPSDPLHPTFPDCHRFFPDNPALNAYDCFGQLNGPGPPLQLGQLQVFQIPDFPQPGSP